MTQLHLIPGSKPAGSGVPAPGRRVATYATYLFAFLFTMMLVTGGFALRSGEASVAYAGLLPTLNNIDNSTSAQSAPVELAVPQNDAFHLISPCNISVIQGQTFTLDLLVNAGGHNITAQQAYLNFTPGLLKVIPPGGTCASNSSTTIQADTTTFEASLQNVVNNTTGEINFASGTFGDPGSGQFRVARLNFCALISGTATINWQFAAPRNTGITDAQVPPNRVENPALYQTCTVTITGGPTVTASLPTQTRTATAAPPAATQPGTSTGTTIPPTSTAGPPASTSVPPTPPLSPSTATPPPPAAAPTATPRPNAPTPTPLPAGSRYFPETKHTVKGLFLNYWNTHGGLPQQGYPITEELQEQSDTNGKVYTMQYFERAVFEHHPEYAAPYNVLLSLLGNFYYNEKYAGNAPNQRATTSNPLKFVETGKTIGGAFRKYWETHGGLPQQGFPISDEFQEISQTDGKTYTVQYFERAVFEYHPEYAGTKDEVLLSLLGVFYDKKKHQRAP